MGLIGLVLAVIVLDVSVCKNKKDGGFIIKVKGIRKCTKDFVNGKK